MRDDLDIAPECGAFAMITLIVSIFFINPEWGAMAKLVVIIAPAAIIYFLPLALSLLAERLNNY